MKHLSKQEMDDILAAVMDGVLAVVDKGKPYCIPFGFVTIDGIVYLSMFPRGRKWACLQCSPQVCFNVFCWNDDHTEWYSVVVEGELEQVRDLGVIESVVRANMHKMGMDPEPHIAKRMEYYKSALENPEKALGIFKINAGDMQGRSMPMLMNRQ